MKCKIIIYILDTGVVVTDDPSLIKYRPKFGDKNWEGFCSGVKIVPSESINNRSKRWKKREKKTENIVPNKIYTADDLKKSGEKDLMSCAIEMMMELTSGERSFIHTGGEIRTEDKNFLSKYSIKDDYIPSFPIGWSSRPERGKSYGESFMTTEFKEMIQKIFNDGKLIKSQKRRASDILAQFEKDLPSKFDLPTLEKIMGSMANCIGTEKRKSSATSESKPKKSPNPFIHNPILKEAVNLLLTSAKEQPNNLSIKVTLKPLLNKLLLPKIQELHDKEGATADYKLQCNELYNLVVSINNTAPLVQVVSVINDPPLVEENPITSTIGTISQFNSAFNSIRNVFNKANTENIE